MLRLFDEYNADRDVNVLTTNLAYGISGTQTLFLGLPYRLSPSGPDRLADLNVLCRRHRPLARRYVGIAHSGRPGGQDLNGPEDTRFVLSTRIHF